MSLRGVRVTFQESADGRIIRLRLAHGETTSRIIGAAFEVHRTLGYGLLEKVYQRAMQVELVKRGGAEMETAIIIRVSSVPIRG